MKWEENILYGSQTSIHISCEKKTAFITKLQMAKKSTTSYLKHLFS